MEVPGVASTAFEMDHISLQHGASSSRLCYHGDEAKCHSMGRKQHLSRRLDNYGCIGLAVKVAYDDHYRSGED
jgi:hypothetical protein